MANFRKQIFQGVFDDDLSPSLHLPSSTTSSTSFISPSQVTTSSSFIPGYLNSSHSNVHPWPVSSESFKPTFSSFSPPSRISSSPVASTPSFIPDFSNSSNSFSPSWSNSSKSFESTTQSTSRISPSQVASTPSFIPGHPNSFHTFVPPPSPPVNIPSSSTSPLSTSKSVNDEFDDENNDESSLRNRFSSTQLETLVKLWAANHKKCESANSSAAWLKILDEVNKESGAKKTKLQIKRKIQNLKQEYKAIKKNNRVSGRARKTMKFFEILDGVLGTRDVITMPAVISSWEDDDNTPPIADDSSPLQSPPTQGQQSVSTETQETPNQPVRSGTRSRRGYDFKGVLEAFQQQQRENMEHFMDRMERMEERNQASLERMQESSNTLLRELINTLNK